MTAKQREGDRQWFPLLAEPVLDRVHRSTGRRTAGKDDPGLHRKGALGELEGHAEDRRYPHPEERARPPVVNRGRNTGDIANADGRRKRCGQGLEMGEIAVMLGIVILATYDLQSVTEVANLDPTEAEGRDEAGAHEKHDQ